MNSMEWGYCKQRFSPLQWLLVCINLNFVNKFWWKAPFLYYLCRISTSHLTKKTAIAFRMGSAAMQARCCYCCMPEA